MRRKARLLHRNQMRAAEASNNRFGYGAAFVKSPLMNCSKWRRASYCSRE